MALGCHKLRYELATVYIRWSEAAAACNVAGKRWILARGFIIIYYTNRAKDAARLSRGCRRSYSNSGAVKTHEVKGPGGPRLRGVTESSIFLRPADLWSVYAARTFGINSPAARALDGKTVLDSRGTILSRANKIRNIVELGFN